MPFYRFEKLKSYHFNPHLSSTTGPIIEGDYMYFRRVRKPAGGKSRLHYHPNEFMAFMLEGKLSAVLGRDRRVAGPGTGSTSRPTRTASSRGKRSTTCT
jgi:hypothetical protein